MTSMQVDNAYKLWRTRIDFYHGQYLSTMQTTIMGPLVCGVSSIGHVELQYDEHTEYILLSDIFWRT